MLTKSLPTNVPKCDDSQMEPYRQMLILLVDDL